MFTRPAQFIRVSVTGFFLLSLIAICIGCKFGVQDRTLSTLEDAIEELGRQPGRWQETMENTIQQLEGAGGELAKTVLAEVRYTYNNILGQTMSEFSCRQDFTAQRLQQRLQAIGHGIDPGRFPGPEIVPVICSTNPGDKIDLNTAVLTFYGYDLLEFGSEQGYRVVLRYADNGEVVRDQGGFVALPTNYQLTIDLQSPQLKEFMRTMDPNRGPQISLRWGTLDIENDSGRQASLPIILPNVPTTRPWEIVSTTNQFGGPFGTWGETEICPKDTWAMGGSLRIEPWQTGNGDDTALNGIRLDCGSINMPGYVSNVDSATGAWGEWEKFGPCKGGYVTGVKLRIEPSIGSGDDTGGVDAEFICSDGRTVTGQTHHQWGEWKSWQTCPVNSAICGLQTKVEGYQGSGDDTALNDATFACCSLP